jgi:hypothetical protein
MDIGQPTETASSFTFTRRAYALPGDLRPDWRLSLLVLMLAKTGRGGTASLEKVHVLNWAVRTHAARKTFLRLLNGNGKPDDAVVRFDPALNRAIAFAADEGLVILAAVPSGGMRVTLTSRGTEAAKQLEGVADCFIEEREFFDGVRGRVSQERISELLNWGARG